MARQGEWPREKRTPEAYFQATGVTEKSNRSPAGPLRYGTSPGVGPRGRSAANDRVEVASDFGMDRVDPREFDPMGTSLDRYGPQPSSELIAREIRGGRRR
ncbi:MAG TPA: hypothetical protein VHT52_24610 [Stellaceae bacterium]|jgi:hypothetical protein|nr:hypothetical protein [Stellaceae bacterium]